MIGQNVFHCDLENIPSDAVEIIINENFYNDWCDLYENKDEKEEDGNKQVPQEEDVITDLSSYKHLTRLFVDCGEGLCPVEITLPSSCQELKVNAKLFPMIIGGKIHRVISDCKYVPENLDNFTELKTCHITDYGFRPKDEVDEVVNRLKERGVDVKVGLL